jgi:hypothetical protein
MLPSLFWQPAVKIIVLTFGDKICLTERFFYLLASDAANIAGFFWVSLLGH